jgi:transcriptional repressor NrdR
MNCPYCQSSQVFVTNSRSTKNQTQIWRRRHCQSCQAVFTTHEIIDLSHLIVIKKSGRKEKFSRAKLFSGIYGAAVGFKGADKEKFVESVTGSLESEILALKKKEILSSEIADLVLKKLLTSNTGTFLRFIAYCKNITTPKQAKTELSHYLK